MDQRPKAHGARLERHIQRRLWRQAIVIKLSASIPECHNLGVRRRVMR